MSNVTILIGLSGVGKSTVLEEAMLLADEDYEVINYGDRMLEIAEEEGFVDSRDEIKELGSETQREVQKRAAESIVEDSEDGNVIVDTHAAIKTPQGFLPGLPKWTIENLEPQKIIMLTADSQEIYNRSVSDSDRNREHDTPEDVETYQQVAREMASAGSVLTGAYLKVLENPPNGAREAAKEFVNVLES